MRQEEIVNEIIKKCGNAEIIPSMGWHFMYNERNLFYITGKDDGIIRFVFLTLSKLTNMNLHNYQRLSMTLTEA